jgi:hypothetical protein
MGSAVVKVSRYHPADAAVIRENDLKNDRGAPYHSLGGYRKV